MNQELGHQIIANWNISKPWNLIIRKSNQDFFPKNLEKTNTKYSGVRLPKILSFFLENQSQFDANKKFCLPC